MPGLFALLRLTYYIINALCGPRNTAMDLLFISIQIENSLRFVGGTLMIVLSGGNHTYSHSLCCSEEMSYCFTHHHHRPIGISNGSEKIKAIKVTARSTPCIDILLTESMFGFIRPTAIAFPFSLLPRTPVGSRSMTATLTFISPLHRRLGLSDFVILDVALFLMCLR